MMNSAENRTAGKQLVSIVLLVAFFFMEIFCYFDHIFGGQMSIFLTERSIFLDASSHLYKRPCPSVGWLVRPLVSWSVKIDDKWPFTDSK